MSGTLENLLYEKFRYPSFKEGQKEVITSVLKGQHTVAVLPTGTGKSLCYQLPAYILEGTVLIVSPLLSLMQDQVEQILMRGEKSVVALNSFLNREEKFKIIQSLSNYRYIFISPEMLRVESIQRKLRQLSISLFVIDEAHCISQWGYDFRPDYMKLGHIRAILGNPLTMALTATATKKVIHDIVSSLQLNQWNEFVSSVDRPNISLKVEEVLDREDKDRRLIELVRILQGPGIVYFSSKKKAEEMADRLNEILPNKVMAYHGGIEANDRTLIQQQYLYGQLDLICATSAFGMGINKENIRYVIHYHMPLTIESYLQEIGRAGRDGLQSIAILLYTPGDESLLYHLIENELPSSSQIQRVGELLQEQSLNHIEQLDKILQVNVGLNETQLRVTTDYLKNDEKNKVNLKASIKRFEDFVHERLQFKLNQVLNVRHFIHTKSCRRENILHYFDESLEKRPSNCCDDCGLQLESFFKEMVSASKEQCDFNWKDYLSNILLKK